MKNIFKTVKGKKIFSAVLICFVVGGLTMSVFYLSNGKSFDDRSMASDRQLPAEYEKADSNGDQKVSMGDFGIWVKLFRSYKNDHTTFDSKGDLNGDKKISMEDFREWLLLWRRYKGGEFPINELIISSISTGVNHTCGLGSDGNAYCWGDNGGGRLGTGDDTASSNLPKLVVQGDRVAGVTFSSIFPGFYHTCGLGSDGNAYCWGDNSYGQLGIGDDTAGNLPKLVVQGNKLTGLTFSSIFPGFYHTCGLGSDGNAYCWGYNGQGRLGTGDDTTSYNLPKLVVRGDRGSGVTFSSISTGGYHTCGLDSDGNAYCWGRNDYGQLGTGDDTASYNIPKLVVQGDRGAGVTFSSISSGFYHTCGLGSDGNAYCWGRNDYGQLGTGDDTASYNIPKLVVQGDRGSGVTFSSISTGGNHTCGLTSDGNAYCWGNNGGGRLGTGDDTASYNIPKLVVQGDRGAGVTFSSISSGFYHTCGLGSDGNAYCWGRNDYGQLGTGDDTASYNIPKLIVKVGVPVIAELPELLVSLSFNGNITNKVTEVKFVSKDSTGNKAPTFVQGKEGEAVFFDGNKDSKYRISYDDEDPLLFAVTSFTIMAYVKKDEGTCNYGRCTIFSKGNSDWQGYSLYLNNARKLTLRLNDKNEGEVSSVEALEDNKWYHVASTYNGTTREIKLYIDGVLSGTSVYGEDINYGNASAMVGNGNTYLDLPFRGAIDEVRFFTTPLSEKEIRTYLLP